MATESAVPVETTAPKIPTYADLVKKLFQLEGEFDGLASRLSQLGALFSAAMTAKVQPSPILDAGHYLASDWANSADCLRDEINELAALAQSAIPKREWRACGMAENPRVEEIEVERRFAAVATGFPGFYERHIAIDFVIADRGGGE